MSKVFLYNITGDKAVKIKLLCRKLYLTAQVVEPEAFGHKIAYLLGISDDNSVAPDSGFTEEMLYLSNIPGPVMSIFLDQLRRKKIPVALKAIQTDTNISFTSYELYKELCEERTALSKQS